MNDDIINKISTILQASKDYEKERNRKTKMLNTTEQNN